MGTTVEVHQLFGNVPARRAFLRSPQTEWSHASEAFVRTALAHPDVAMTLTHNGRRVHDLPATTSWRERIGGLFGPALAAKLIEVSASDGELSVSGLVGRPEDDMAGTRLQYLFVAGRPFRDRGLLHAVQEGYRGLMLTGRQPIVFLTFSMPAEMVDVNVHPAKMEVRFREPSRLYKLVLAALRTAFLEHDLTAPLLPPVDRGVVADADRLGAVGQSPADVWSRSTVGPPPGAGAARSAEPAVFRPWEPLSSRAQGAAAATPAAPLWERDDTTGSFAVEPPPARERAVQMQDRYIVVECGDGIEVIDQHALHERLLYERLKASLAAGSLEVQPLLIPERIDLSPTDLELITDHAEPLARAGLRIEPFGGGTVVATSKPVLAGSTPAEEIVREVLERLAALENRGNPAVLVDEVLHGLACKAAIKAGDALSPAEVEALVRDRRVVRESHHCPHGRPTSLVFSRAELDRQFRRT